MADGDSSNQGILGGLESLATNSYNWLKNTLQSGPNPAGQQTLLSPKAAQAESMEKAGTGEKVAEDVQKAVDFAKKPLANFQEDPTFLVPVASAKLASNYLKQHGHDQAAKVLDAYSGVMEGGADLATSMSSPANLGMMFSLGRLKTLGVAGTALDRLISAGFSIKSLHDAYNQYPDVKKAIDSGDWETAGRAITNYLGTTAVGVTAAHGTVEGLGKAKPTVEVLPPEAKTQRVLPARQPATIDVQPVSFDEIGGKKVADATLPPAGAQPNIEVAESANRYNAAKGQPEISHAPGELASPEDRAALADKYEALQHAPNDPAVKKAYDAMKKETMDQFHHAQNDLGVNFEFTPDNPYENAEQMTTDLRDNHHLAVYTGGNELPEGHPLSEIEPTTGQPYNNLFRATHDVYGHAAGGNEFTEAGEENAYRAHTQMYSPEARPAMQNETQGQSNWYFNNKAVREGKEMGDFAPQKAAVLPAEESGVLNLEKGKSRSTTVSGDVVVQHLRDTSPQPLSKQSAEEQLGINRYSNWELKSVPVSSLTAGDDYSPATAKDYARRTTPLPAIILDDDGNILNGNHRVAAAKLRGDQTIQAYVPVSERPFKNQSPDQIAKGQSESPLLTKAREMFPKVESSDPPERSFIAPNGDFLSADDNDHFAVSALYPEDENLHDEDAINAFMDDTGALRNGLYEGTYLVHGGKVAPTVDQLQALAGSINYHDPSITEKIIIETPYGSKDLSPESNAGTVRREVEKLYKNAPSLNLEKKQPHLEAPPQIGAVGTPTSTVWHEGAHAAIAHMRGIGKADKGVYSHLHPEAVAQGSIGQTPIKMNDDILSGDGYIKGTKLIQHINDFMDMLLAGGVTEEQFHDVPWSENAGSGALNSDIGYALRMLKAVGITEPRDIARAFADAKARVQRDLTAPGMEDIMHEYFDNREEGLDPSMHVSPERLNEFQERMTEQHEQNNTGSETGQAAGGNGARYRGPSERVAAAAVARGKSEGTGQPAQATLSKSKGISKTQTDLARRGLVKNSLPEDEHPAFIYPNGAQSAYEDGSHMEYAIEGAFATESSEDPVGDFIKDTKAVRISDPTDYELTTEIHQKPTESQMQVMADYYKRRAKELGHRPDMIWDLVSPAGKAISGSGSFAEFKRAVDKIYGADFALSKNLAIPEEDTSFEFGANASESGTYHPDLQKVADRYGIKDSPSVGRAAFITPDGKWINLQAGTTHPQAIESSTGERDIEDEAALGENLNPENKNQDSRIRFLNDTGAVRIRRTPMSRAGAEIHISVPEQGVTPEQIEAIKQDTAKTLGRGGRIAMERADITPETKDQLSRVNDYGNANSIEPMLKEIQAHPDKTAAGWAESAAKSARKNSAGGIDPLTGTSDEKGIGAEFMPEARQPLDHTPTADDFRAFYEKNKAILDADPNLRVGWDNNSNVEGGHELNIGAVGKGAVKMARKLDQRAAWDIGKKEEITTGGEGLQKTFPNYPPEERLKDLNDQSQSSIPKFEEMPERVVGLMNDDLRTYLSDKPDLQKRIMSELHKNPVPVEEGIASAQAGADLNGWWRRYIDIFNRIGDAGVNKESPESVPYSEILKQWHAALSGNKVVEDANNLAFHSFLDWLDAGKPTTRAGIDKIIRKNGMQPEGSEKKGNAALSDTHRKGKVVSEGIDTSKILQLVNSPEMRGEKPFTGKIYSEEHPIRGKGLQYRKIPSMGATVAGQGDLSNAVVDTHMFDFLGLNRTTEARYIANSLYLTDVGQQLGLPTGEAQEQIWGTVLKFKTLLKEGLTPEEAADKIMKEGVYEEGKDYSDIIVNDPEVSGKGGVLDKLKNKYGIGPGSAGIAQLHAETRAAEPARTTEASEKPIDKAHLAVSGGRIKGTIAESKIKKPSMNRSFDFSSLPSLPPRYLKPVETSTLSQPGAKVKK